jgi:hypothetical protein
MLPDMLVVLDQLTNDNLKVKNGWQLTIGQPKNFRT